MILFDNSERGLRDYDEHETMYKKNSNNIMKINRKIIIVRNL